MLVGGHVRGHRSLGLFASSVRQYGNCYQFRVSSAAFKASDSQYYWYYRAWQTSAYYIHFCDNPDTGGGTCYWANIVIGYHDVESYPALYDSDGTYAECSGC